VGFFSQINGAYTSSSDRNLKDEVNPDISDDKIIEAFSHMPVRCYRMKDD
jgi:hypothetical protein